MVYNWPGIIQQWLFPPTCLLCGAHATTGQDLCAGCERTLPFIRSSCVCCALPLTLSEQAVCGHCLRHPPDFDSAFALLVYRDPVRYLIHELKFRRQYPMARLLGGLLAAGIEGTRPVPELLVPVPLHPRRLRERGFNPSLEIAREVGRHLGVDIGTEVVTRTRPTASQAGLPASQRARNVRGAFSAKKDIQRRHVAIIDDVMTTGATAGEIARTLRQAGVETIEVWACARAIPEQPPRDRR
ncbi:double zinc ribbon domain-containing protein [Methylolobus aquaticus]